MDIEFQCDKCKHTTPYTSNDLFAFVRKGNPYTKRIIVYCGECGKEFEITITTCLADK